jgi:hypothetical protein
MKSSKFQHPSSRESLSTKLQTEPGKHWTIPLIIGAWSFFGDWMLVSGASAFTLA